MLLAGIALGFISPLFGVEMGMQRIFQAWLLAWFGDFIDSKLRKKFATVGVFNLDKGFSMKQSLRHQQIIKLVEQSGYLSTEELVAALDVSPQTIRRDLNILAELDLIRRHHGGAASPSSAENSDYVDRKQFFSLQKNNIAQEVAKLIPNGASLFIDNWYHAWVCR